MSYLVVNVRQGSDEWRQWRKKEVTATDSVVNLGKSPHKTPWRVWAEKSGYAEEEDLSGNPYVWRGSQEEHRIRSAVEERHSEILLPVCVRSRKHPFLIASLDGISGKGIPYELKYPSEGNWEDVLANGVNSKPYRLYVTQVQHQLLVTGADHGYLVFYQHGRIQEFRVEPDREIHERIVLKGRLLLHRVQTGSPPGKDPEKDLFIPEGDAAESWLFFAGQFRELQAEIDTLAAQKKEIEARMDALKKEREPSFERLKKLAEGYRFADYGGVELTQFTPRGAVDIDALIKGEGLSLSEDDLNRYRKKRKPQCRIKIKESLKPELINDAGALAPVKEHIEQQAEDFFY